MDQLSINNLKVSSKRIAQKTGKEHKHVIRDIKSMLLELDGEDGPKLDHAEAAEVLDNRGYTVEYLLNERLSLCLASGYSIKLRMAIIDDWAEMKSNQNSTGYELPKTHADALRALAQKIEDTEKMQAQLEQQKPAVDFYNAVTDSRDAQPMGEVAKILNLGIGRTKLFMFLRDEEILMDNNVPYQTYIDRGYFRVIEQKFQKPDGSTKINIKTLAFQKGMEFILKLYKKKNL